MIIQCENCDTKYTIPEGSIGVAGRFVRCTHCAHEWVAYATTASEAIIPPFKRMAYQEQQYLHNSSFAFYGAMLFALCGLLLNIFIGSALIPDKIIEELPSYIPLWGKNHNHDIMITDIHTKLYPVNAHSAYEIGLDVTVYNGGSKMEQISNVRITAFDKDKQRIAELLSPNQYAVQPEERKVIHSRIKDIPLATRYISIEFGGSIELFIRSANSLIEYRMV